MTGFREKLKENWSIYITWLCMLILAIWIILKLFGIINTPTWVEMIPSTLILIVLITTSNTSIRNREDIKELKKDFKSHQQHQIRTDHTLLEIKYQLKEINAKLT